MPQIRDKFFRTILFEGFGTAIVVYGIGCASQAFPQRSDITQPPDPFIFSCALLVGLALAGEITVSHFNPIVTIGAYAAKRIRSPASHIIGQILGGIIGALLFYGCSGKTFIPGVQKKGGIYETSQIVNFCINEFVGGFFYTMCVLTLTNKHVSSSPKSWQKYLSIPVALFLVRQMTGQTVLNPVAGIPFQILSAIARPQDANAVKSLVFLFPSIVGGLLGGFVTRYLFEPVLLYNKFEELSKEE